jgi:hypothetical protein
MSIFISEKKILGRAATNYPLNPSTSEYFRPGEDFIIPPTFGVN